MTDLVPDDGAVAVGRPVVAVVGRPNVGKSTLVNRILGRREAVVQDIPGVTRDRVSYDAEWAGRDFVVVDTGGWRSDAKGMAAQIAEQSELAIAAADAVLFVVDAFEVADISASDKIGYYLSTGGGWINTGKSFGTGYHHIAFTISTTTVTGYYDGVQFYTAAGTPVSELAGRVVALEEQRREWLRDRRRLAERVERKPDAWP